MTMESNMKEKLYELLEPYLDEFDSLGLYVISRDDIRLSIEIDDFLKRSFVIDSMMTIAIHKDFTMYAEMARSNQRITDEWIMIVNYVWKLITRWNTVERRILRKLEND